MVGFPAQRTATFHLVAGDQETEAMYQHGHDLPIFAMFSLLDRPQAVADICAMFERYLETVPALADG